MIFTKEMIPTMIDEIYIDDIIIDDDFELIDYNTELAAFIDENEYADYEES